MLDSRIQGRKKKKKAIDFFFSSPHSVPQNPLLMFKCVAFGLEINPVLYLNSAMAKCKIQL